MGASKSDHFTKDQNELAGIARALAHPARIAILQHLVAVKSCVCGDIVDELPLAQPTISQHLKELKNAGLIKGIIEGNAVCYCIDHEVWKRYRFIFLELFESLKHGNGCC